MKGGSPVVVLLHFCAVALIVHAADRPHIIFIVADDLGYNDVSFHGSDQIPTPNIDFLAYNGIILNNYYVSPICTPTRSAIMTGRHPIHTGMQNNVIVGTMPYGLPLTETLMPQYLNTLGYRSRIVGKVSHRNLELPNSILIIYLVFHGMQCGVIMGSMPYGLPLTETLMPQHLNTLGYRSRIVGKDGVLFGASPYGLPLTETLMPQHLNGLGYRSHMVGKWHLGFFEWAYTPVERGFESHLGYYQGCEDYYDHTYEANEAMWGLDFRQDRDLLWNMTGKYSTDIFRDEALNIINKHNTSEPLFLYIPFQAVHSGNGDETHLQAPAEYIKRFDYIENQQRRIYAAMVSVLDDAVGQIYDTLKSRGMLNNSIIVFTTDNGGPSNGFDMNAASNFPLRGVKATLWEGGVKGVGLVHSPLLQTQGYVSDRMLHVCDWLPTLFTAAGGNASELKNLDGVSAWDMLSQNGSDVRTELLHNINPVRVFAGVRVGEFKLVIGDVGMSWDGWYPPFQLNGDEYVLHYSNFSDKYVESAGKRFHRRKLEEKYKSYWGPEVISRLEELYKDSSASGLNENMHLNKRVNGQADLLFTSEKAQGVQPRLKNQASLKGVPVTIDCGEKPANASTNCDPVKSPCLFHIPSDPCEYNNIASLRPEVVTQLFLRIEQYSETMVPPANKPYDDRGNPSHHNGAWVPWE